jgi:endonuclease YncB( thermonuclease family)
VREVIRFRGQRSRLTPGRKTGEKFARRPRNAPWPPLTALLCIAGGLWFALDLYPNVIAGQGTFALRPASEVRPKVIRGAGTGSRSQPHLVAVDGSFTLCAVARQPNCVIDGDTIRYGGVKIRLADIDTPETFEPRCAGEAALAQRATLRLLELMNAGPFEVTAGGRDEDLYGRKLRVIERGGRSLGDMLIAEGLARRWDGARRSWCG